MLLAAQPRVALRPRNLSTINAPVPTATSKPNPPHDNKENHVPLLLSPPPPLSSRNSSTQSPSLLVQVKEFQVECFQTNMMMDSSLADELGALREKLERVRIDKDRTDKLLTERALTLDLQMKEILSRWEEQKQLEMELDRLYRLQQIRLASERVSPLLSLREKEQAKTLQMKL